MEENRQALRIVARVFGVLLALGTFLGMLFLACVASGISIFVFIDLISFFIVVLIPYFLMMASSGSMIFFLKKTQLKAFANLMLAFGFLGFVLGLILTFASAESLAQVGGAPYSMFGKSIAVSLIPILYGIIMKFFIIFPIQQGMEDDH